MLEVLLLSWDTDPNGSPKNTENDQMCMFEGARDRSSGAHTGCTGVYYQRYTTWNLGRLPKKAPARSPGVKEPDVPTWPGPAGAPLPANAGNFPDGQRLSGCWPSVSKQFLRVSRFLVPEARHSPCSHSHPTSMLFRSRERTLRSAFSP